MIVSLLLHIHKLDLNFHELQIDSEQFQKILKYIRLGKESGATLETGGERFGTKGYYVQPTVFSNVKVWLKCSV